MSDAIMAAARELIENGRLAEARQILLTVDTPKAKQWIAQIDSRIGPPKTDMPVQATSAEPQLVYVQLPPFSKEEKATYKSLFRSCLLIILSFLFCYVLSSLNR